MFVPADQLMTSTFMGCSVMTFMDRHGLVIRHNLTNVEAWHDAIMHEPFPLHARIASLSRHCLVKEFL
jgi:hypothetical protein